MKKLVAVLMILCLMMTAVAALAEETETTVVNWSDHEADAAGIEGQFAAVAETGLIMFIPAEFADTDIDEETLAGGTFMILKTENEEKAVINAQVVSADPAVFRASVESQGITVWDMVINGLPCIQFSVETMGVITSSFAFGTEQGGVLVFSFTLSDQEPYASLYKVMAASIQPAE